MLRHMVLLRFTDGTSGSDIEAIAANG